MLFDNDYLDLSRSVFGFHSDKRYVVFIQSKNPFRITDLKYGHWTQRVIVNIWDWPKKSLLVKDLQFLFYSHETWSN